MELERETRRQTYQLCRLGFAILSIALVLACVTSLVVLMCIFVGPWPMAWIIRSAWWRWIDTPIVWGSLVGSYLLWGRWHEAGWQRRTGLLVLMGTLDVVLWLLEHGEPLGLRLSEIGHPWLRSELGGALGWAEFTLIASLAGDLMAHLGIEQAPEASKATRSLAATGTVVWFLFFCQQTNWHAGWPLREKGVHTVEAYLLFLGTHMIWSITLIQVTALSIAAARQASSVLAEMDREDRDHDLLNSPSETDVDLLSTFPEEAPDDPRRRPL